MSKSRIDSNLMKAIDVLKKLKIAENGKCDPKYRSQISAFGASVVMGSFKSSIAFYSQQGNADVDRSLLVKAMYYIVSGTDQEDKSAEEIFEEICASDDIAELQEAYLDASVSLKLAMNFFDMGKGTKEQNG